MHGNTTKKIACLAKKDISVIPVLSDLCPLGKKCKWTYQIQTFMDP